VTEEHAERLREQANQLPEPSVVRLLDLLAVAVDDQRRGGDPRLPLELALVKVTRPHADLSRESLSHRIELLESRVQRGPASPAVDVRAGAGPSRTAPTHELTLDQLRDAWKRSVLSAVEQRSIPIATLLRDAAVSALADGTVTLAFPSGAEFHRAQLDDPRSLQIVHEALFEVTGQRLAIVTERSQGAEATVEDDEPLDEQRLISLLQDELNATEVEETT
jgi:hypothetical protein